jgi:hypothetical protein
MFAWKSRWLWTEWQLQEAGFKPTTAWKLAAPAQITTGPPDKVLESNTYAMPVRQGHLAEESRGVDSSSTTASCLGPNPTGVISPTEAVWQHHVILDV